MKNQKKRVLQELSEAIKVFESDDSAKQMMTVFVLKTYFSALWETMSEEIANEARAGAQTDAEVEK